MMFYFLLSLFAYNIKQAGRNVTLLLPIIPRRSTNESPFALENQIDIFSSSVFRFYSRVVGID